MYANSHQEIQTAEKKYFHPSFEKEGCLTGFVRRGLAFLPSRALVHEIFVLDVLFLRRGLRKSVEKTYDRLFFICKKNKQTKTV